jgi:hypothetical protein
MFLRFVAALVLLACAIGVSRADEAGDRADTLLSAGDLDKNGKFEWNEAFERWNNFRDALKLVEGDEDLEAKIRATFVDLMEPLDYLGADADDNLVLTRKELFTWLKAESTEKAAEPSRKDLETFSTSAVNAAWATLCKLLDADQDGQFSRAELDEKYPTDVNDDCFKASDKNKDGKLDKAEYAIFKVEEFQRGLFVEFDEQGGSVGGAGQTGAEAGEKEVPKAAGNEKDAGKKTEAKAAKASRIKVGTHWTFRCLVGTSEVDGKEIQHWKYELNTISAIVKQGGDDVVEHKDVEVNENGEVVPDGSGGGGAGVLYIGKNAKYLPAAKDLVSVTVKAGTFDCAISEIKDYPSRRAASRDKKLTAKCWTTYIDGMPLCVKIELEGEIIVELLEFKEK